MSGPADSILLVSLPATALLFALVLCRVSAVVMLMPGLGETSSPMTVRAGLAVGLTFLIAPTAASIFAADGLTDAAPLRVLALASVELFVGLFLGWLARLAAMILPLAGQFLSLLTGLSSVLQPDPELGAETSVLSRFFSLLAPVLLLTSGIYIYPIRALVGSYDFIPPGGALWGAVQWPILEDTTHVVIQTTERMFVLSLELIAPFLLLSVLWQIALGIVSRVIPNLQIYNLATPLQIIGGLALLALLLRPMTVVWGNWSFDMLSHLPGL
ncbi:flagellar biosynthetic protein FliR [Neoasaia chiangmaiensis NBRC 101099]|uniref:Flagellar biosynthesis protein FliR n=1 Tax=Neoasaia chiangmaiensis TaxID=320497 RepID=A0A1U9KQV6_9PROT|nr:flagellar biosynthetic protein FliR [Neoasaia chiangmaiensis]AQS88208.1 flagellar biosynthesis protein FliR [Neoasaia chiangmaiensis]GBR39856.1 flagellar biosynthetic protein FliR [Neoasaia chiangmaiensis NBRC 101099]GEN14772.1 flagellar biosynthetic protein FliR [Neoasaia chiangmaiensis]